MIAPVTSTPQLGKPDNAALKDVAASFEALFLRQIIGEMRKAQLADDIFGSEATGKFREMADANMADVLAKRGSFGIAALIEQQFTGRGSGT
jgi:peptidoglycan hydrolase FlgJ